MCGRVPFSHTNTRERQQRCDAVNACGKMLAPRERRMPESSGHGWLDEMRRWRHTGTNASSVCFINGDLALARKTVSDAIGKLQLQRNTTPTVLLFRNQTVKGAAAIVQSGWQPLFASAHTYATRAATCDIVILRMDAATAGERMELQMELRNILRLAKPGALVMAYSEGLACSGTRNCYFTLWGACRYEHCWVERWHQLLKEQIVQTPRQSTEAACNAMLLGTARKRTARWCVGHMDAQPLCGAQAPLIQPALRRSAEDVTIVNPAQGARYFSVFACGEQVKSSSPICLLCKNDPLTGIFVANSDDGIVFRNMRKLLSPSRYGFMTPNLGILARGAGEPHLINGSSFMVVGGLHTYDRARLHHGEKVVLKRRGVFLSSTGAQSLAWNAPGALRGRVRWTTPSFALNGLHPGCVEERDPEDFRYLVERTSPSRPGMNATRACEFDGRLTLVHFGGEYLLYARANTGLRGQRFVQLTRSVDATAWSPFELISIDGYSYERGNIYFWAAQVNPVDHNSLVATFPIVHHLVGCIGISFSRDGRRWSQIAPLLACDAVDERTLSHPAAPSLLRHGDDVWLYVQHDVPGITGDAAMPGSLHKRRRAEEQRSYLKRYSVTVLDLQAWTRNALKTL